MSGKTRRIWGATRKTARQLTALALSGFLVALVGCSSAQIPSTNNNSGGGGTGNVATIAVDGGPFASTQAPYANGAFTSVTVCVPGSTTQCQTIGGILVDTGSYGLRIENSALTLSLPQQTDSGGNPIAECAEFGSGFAWGPVQTADFTIAGESAKSMPVHIMGSTNFPDNVGDGAAACAAGTNGASLAGTNFDYDVATNLGANGILGVGNFAQDCGPACAQSGNSNPGEYYSCPSAATCTVTTEAVASQVVNPVAMFSTDNNGVIVELQGLTGGEGLTVNGSLIFGIGTESNNGLGSATVYDLDPSSAQFTTVFNSQPYTDAAFVDSGSNAFYFLDSAVTNLPQCTQAGLTFLYCPTNDANLSATNEGFSNGNSGTVNFTIADAESVLSNTSDNAFGTIGGSGQATDGTLYFDWGLPFFYGTNVYVAIDGATTPGGPGPYVAY